MYSSRILGIDDSSFRIVVEYAPNGIVMVDHNGHIILVNNTSERMFGYHRSELIGQPIEMLVPEAARMRHPTQRGSYQHGPEARPMGAGRDLAALCKDGSTLPVEIGLTPIPTDVGVYILATVIDISERKKNEDHRETLVRELSHRVKNNLAVVQSIASLTAANAETKEEFIEAFTGRLSALGSAHSLLAEADWEDTDLRALLDRVLEPFQTNNAFTVLGHRESLSAATTSSLSICFHELATNAVKYGALHYPDGKIIVTWKRTTPTNLRIEWSEPGGPNVVRPSSKTGFGMLMIERTIIHQLRGTVKMEFDPAGLRCVFDIPAKNGNENG
jgi:PAS domain S-box-containing protein